MSKTNETKVERPTDRDIVVIHTFEAPAHLVWDAWTKAELFRKWWVPKSFGLELLSCEMDVRVDGQYRLVFPHGDSTVAFFGTYREVVPHERLVWTNDEGVDGQSLTTVTFEESGDKTRVTVHDRYPSAEAVDVGSTGALPESLVQLDELLAKLR